MGVPACPIVNSLRSSPTLSESDNEDKFYLLCRVGRVAPRSLWVLGLITPLETVQKITHKDLLFGKYIGKSLSNYLMSLCDLSLPTTIQEMVTFHQWRSLTYRRCNQEIRFPTKLLK
ncbi:unnamed protein product [Albugo candida]|uniref:Uncharacterized protein n=1 Tax=Albugo candida TaxID=65357 RepID=A0A024GJW5_9STRA|nr:unnamed protein product [Albugo candida]|eukprot:CCI46807.1 unnamed protein product [Albugo candida]